MCILKVSIGIGQLCSPGRSFMASFCLMVLQVFFFSPVKAQDNEYEKALSRFTGPNKYDIERPGAMVGVAAPDFEGKTLDGKKISLGSLKGKVVVLNFWFIACAPCKTEVAPFNELIEKYRKEKDLVFVSIAKEKKQDLAEYLAKHPFLFQTIADPDASLSNQRFHVLGYPTTMVIDRQGKISYYSLGGKILEDAVRKEFEEKLVPVIQSELRKK